MFRTSFNLGPPNNVYPPLLLTGMASLLGIRTNFHFVFKDVDIMGDVFGRARVNYPIIIIVPFTCHVSLWFGVFFDRTSLFFKMLQEGLILANHQTWNRSRLRFNAWCFGFRLLSLLVSWSPLRVSYLFEATFSRVSVLSTKGAMFGDITRFGVFLVVAYHDVGRDFPHVILACWSWKSSPPSWVSCRWILLSVVRLLQRGDRHSQG